MRGKKNNSIHTTFITLLCLLNKESHLKYLNITVFYLSTILSFIGASYWGISLNKKNMKNNPVIFSVIPAILVVFFYVLEIGVFLNLILCVFLMNIILLFEKYFFLSFIPKWYFKLRVTLNKLVTAIVFVIILITISY